MIVLEDGLDVSFGWIGWREPDHRVVEDLREIDPDADARWVPGPFERPPCWDIGVWWQPNSYHRGMAGQILERHLNMPVAKQDPRRIKYAHDVLAGWRVVFRIQGRAPDARDVAEFRMRDWLFRNHFEREIRRQMDAIENQEKRKQDQFRKDIRDRAEGDETMNRIIRGGFSVRTHGIGHLTGAGADTDD